jgi:hypothetical protein
MQLKCLAKHQFEIQNPIWQIILKYIQSHMNRRKNKRSRGFSLASMTGRPRSGTTMAAVQRLAVSKTRVCQSPDWTHYVSVGHIEYHWQDRNVQNWNDQTYWKRSWQELMTHCKCTKQNNIVSNACKTDLDNYYECWTILVDCNRKFR